MGKLFVVGIGPGGPDGMTIAARRALEAADIVVGYTKYVELALAAVPDAAHLATPMMHEVERCRLALSRAQSGEAVALVCSGDAGVYGMASPVLELAEDYPDVDVEVIAGATAAQSGSAVLGAPLAHDFAVVSLSDLLTPWDVIERRLAAVASADFCICLKWRAPTSASVCTTRAAESAPTGSRARRRLCSNGRPPTRSAAGYATSGARGSSRACAGSPSWRSSTPTCSPPCSSATRTRSA